jgi:acyl-CoA thioesterase-1
MTQFAGDLFHPNDRGYKVWADAFWPAVSRRAASIESRSDVRELGARATAG